MNKINAEEFLKRKEGNVFSTGFKEISTELHNRMIDYFFKKTSNIFYKFNNYIQKSIGYNLCSKFIPSEKAVIIYKNLINNIFKLQLENNKTIFFEAQRIIDNCPKEIQQELKTYLIEKLK